jgi:ABC-type multidrug transport system fused ATPase/permease subunit
MRIAIGKILALLSPSERRRGLLVLGMVIVMAFLEIVGVASVMPFLAVLSRPEMIDENPLLSWSYGISGVESVNGFLFILGVGAFSLIVFGAVFRIVTKYAMYRFTEMRRHSIGSRLLGVYLRQPYGFFLNRHSDDMAKSILSEVDQLVVHVLTPGFNILANSVVAFAIVLFLIVVDPMLALIVGSTIGGCYAMIYLGVRGLLGRIGRDRTVANRQRFTSAGEAIRGIKDIKLLGREDIYLRRFSEPSRRFAGHQAVSMTAAEVPKYLIEAIGFGGILGLALYLMIMRDGIDQVLPLLGLYAIAGYRLLPAAQHIYAGVSKLRFGMAAVDEVYSDIVLQKNRQERLPTVPEPLVPSISIALEDVSYIYPGGTKGALCDINMVIPVGMTVGIIGGTGAGKTTAVDLLLGLLSPTSGALKVDGVPIADGEVRAWQRSLGYVPQDIFLFDASIMENIAFGVDVQDIDIEAVERAAKAAQLHDFITKDLPMGYSTGVGERGVRLSGGQRQRIGIARALYYDPPVLVLDEATSALDTATEVAVMEAVRSLRGRKTIIMIAHRLTTVEQCDRIFLLKDGKVQAEGDYGSLYATEPELRRLAGTS